MISDLRTAFHVREEQPYSLVLDVPRTLDAVGITKVGLDAMMESMGWFCATRDSSSDTYYHLGDEPYQYLCPHTPRTEGALVRRLEELYGPFHSV